jgi:SAM-dependent methyltransferase
MDKKTLDVYDGGAKKYCEDWLSQPTPVEIHEIVYKYFQKATPTADIGSGSGRDAFWLNSNGYPCTGFDASDGLLKEAKQRFPDVVFKYAKLPNLNEIADGAFQNVLCETVLMHLPNAEHESSLKNLLRILRPGGTLSLSWRHPIDARESREKDGRLYESIDRNEMITWAEKYGATCLHKDSFISPSSGKRIDQIILRKST